MWDLNYADADDDHHQYDHIPSEEEDIEEEEEDLENFITTTTSSAVDVVSNNNNNNTSSSFTYTLFDIMTTTTNANDVASCSSSIRQRCSRSTTDWLNLSSPSSSSFPDSGVASSDHMMLNQQQQQMPAKKSRRGPRSRSSQYRGVTFYRRTGRWESHIWDCGKQVYLGGFDTAHAAARAYDRAAIKFRGLEADINFNIADYQDDIGQMMNLSKEEFVRILRRQPTGFAKGTSKYRGLTLHNCGRWEAGMGQLLGKKAYDVAALGCNGSEAATNFEPSTHDGDLASLAIENDASGHDLDLSLGIHSSSKYNPKWNHASSSEPWNDPKLVYSTSAAGKGQIHVPYNRPSTSTNYLAMSQGMATYSGSYFPLSYEVQSTVVPSSSRMPSWGWQYPQGHGSTTSIGRPPFYGAASSGFSLPSSVIPTTSIMQQARQSHPYQHFYSRP